MEKILKQLGKINHGEDYVTFSEDDPVKTEVKSLILSFPTVKIKHGIQSDFEIKNSYLAVKECNETQFGGIVKIVYDEAWENGECDGRAEIQITCPTLKDIVASLNNEIASESRKDAIISDMACYLCQIWERNEPSAKSYAKSLFNLNESEVNKYFE